MELSGIDQMELSGIGIDQMELNGIDPMSGYK